MAPALFEEKQGIEIHGRPAWMSPDLWQTLTSVMSDGRLDVGVVFSKAERKRLRKKKPVMPSIWSEDHRVLIKSVLPGAWRNSVTPYLVGIMDTAARPFVREITTCKAPQTGVSECINNFIGWTADRAPGDWLCTYPDETTSNTNFKDRIGPMMKNSVRLRSYLTGNKNDLTDSRLHLQHMDIYGAWATSVATMANKPIKYANSDEIDKPGFRSTSKETSPLNQIDKRLNTFRSVSKHFKTSTPTVSTGLIWVELTTNTDVIFDFYARCPFCGQMQLMKMAQIKWNGGSGADSAEVRNKRSAWYECEHCQGHWDDNLRNMAVQGGGWLSRSAVEGGDNLPWKGGIAIDAYLEKFRPARVGFHLPAWISYFVSLSECAAAFLDSFKSKDKLKDFRNSFEALPWEEYEVLVKQEDSDVLECKAEIPPQVVPESAVALTCCADLHKAGFPFVVRAHAKDYTSWNIHYGHLGSWGDLEELLFEKSYPVEGSDRRLRIWRAGLDTGGGKYKKDISSTEEAYLWLQENSRRDGFCRIWGMKGSPRPLQSKLKLGSVLTKTPSGKALKMGLQLVHLDTDRLKDLFYERMARARKEESGGAWLHSEVKMDYARQITAERKQLDEKGIETWIQIRDDNHWLDCECGAMVLADWEWPGGGVNLFPDPGRDNRVQNKKTKAAAPVGGGGRGRPSWFNRR
jgi:phage terminase large subunit GpA-like protein